MGKYFFIFAFLLFFTSVGHADSSACTADREKFCKNVRPGAARLTQCFAMNEAKLSPDCLKYRETLKAQLKEVKEVCQDDFERYCSDKQAGRGDILQCLKKNRSKLSKVCKRDLNNRGKIQRQRKAKQEGKIPMDKKPGKNKKNK